MKIKPRGKFIGSLGRFFFHPRFIPVYAGMIVYGVGSFFLRLILEWKFGRDEPHGLWMFLQIHLHGFQLDLAMAFWVCLLFELWILLLPNKLFLARWHRILFEGAFVLSLASRFFLFCVEYEFFEEFNSRFTTVAVDYLLYPHEVFINIWDSYPVLKISFGCLLSGCILYVLIRPLFRRTWTTPVRFGRKLSWFGTMTAIGVLLTSSLTSSPASFTKNRVLREIAGNGQFSFFQAAYTRHLDFPAFYRTLSLQEAFSRTRRLIATPEAVFDENPDSIQRFISSNNPASRTNLVIILVESFGSEFWESLGSKGPQWTPQMDALSEEGILFTNLYASGNRTVRGFEGVLSSFPPLPGDSIVKRNLSDHVSTLARTLKAKNYRTLFLYGGRGVFDGMRSYAVKNGYDRFIEQKHFKNPIFSTIWGVCDEDLFNRTIEELREFSKGDRPFFVTALTVSNHKPYTFPRGRIPENPDQHARPFAVKYTDYALGQFFERVKKEAFYKNTIFAVVADHGARVYGSQTIPIESYRIPLLIVGGPIKPFRMDTLGSSLDVGPTLLGLMGLSYQSVFFGRDLFDVKPGDGWVVMNHNRDVGLYKNGRMVVLGLKKSVEYFRMDRQTDFLSPLAKTHSDEFEDLLRDTISIYQVADWLYTTRNYKIHSSP